MQTANRNYPITITGRHVSITEAMREHAQKKVESLHLDYPRITEARVILDVESGFRHRAEFILHCCDHITIEASSTTEDMYASIDETLSKVARRMRKYKTRMLKRNHRPFSKKQHDGTKLLAEHIVLPEDDLAAELPLPAASAAAAEAVLLVHRDRAKIKTLREDEAIEALETGESPFVVFQNEETERLSILFRRDDGDYGIIEPDRQVA
ncbi:MAG: ribosome-associated translation inhibitor RaiA [Verrucomicrobiota bacterium]